jgi:hypothetical protein
MQLYVPIRRGQAKPWSSIPRINCSHPLTAGLTNYWYDTGTGAVIDLVTGRTMVPAAGNVKPPPAGSPFGRANYYSTVGLYGMVDPATNPKQAWAAPFSFACGWWQVATPVTGANPVYFTLQDNTGNTPFALYTDTSNLRIAYGNASPAIAFTQPGNNTFNVFVGVATGASTQSNYLNATLFSSTQTSAYTGTVMSYNINGTDVGWSASATESNAAIVYFGAVWLRALSATEAAQLYQDPYCFLIYPEDEMFATLVGIATITSLPYNQYDYPQPRTIRASASDLSQSLNPNLFKNPIPFNQVDWSKPFRVPKAPFDLSVPLNPNLFKNPFPNNQYNYPQPFRIRRSPYDLSVPLNPNIFKNPYPTFNGDGSSSKINPDWAPAFQQPYNPNLYTVTVAFPFNQTFWPIPWVPKKSVAPPDPLNINLFTNPYPFNQYDWSKPVAVPQARLEPNQTLNPNIFTNPYPFNQYDYLKPLTIPQARLEPNQSLNINLFTNPYPFNQVDWSKPFFPHFLPYPQDGININIFTNPIPFLNIAYTPTVPVPNAPVDFYNVVLIDLSFPLNQYDFATPVRQRPLPNQDQVYNPNLYTVVIFAGPFNQTDFSKPVTVPRALLVDQQFNPNLFTNPYPILNPYDFQAPRQQRPLPNQDQPYNQNLYTVVVTTTPFNQTDFSTPFRLRGGQANTDSAFNPNLLTNPIPFNQFDYPQPRRVPKSPFDLSVATNLNIFTNPIPIFNYVYTPQKIPYPTPLDTSQGFQILYQPVVTVTLIQRTLTGVGI